MSPMWIGIFFDTLLITSIALWIIGLLSDGALSLEYASIALVGLVVMIALGRATGMGVVRLAIRAGIPIAGFMAFVGWRAGGDYGAMLEIATPLLALFLVLLAFYIMFLGLFGGGRK